MSVRADSARTDSARPSALRTGGADILLAACLWGTTGTVRTFAPEASSLSISAVRIVLGGLVLAVLVGCTGRGGALRALLGTRRGLVLIALGAVAISVYQTAFFTAAARTGVAIGTVVTIGSAPAFSGLLGVLTRQSRLTGRWVLATAGAVSGCALLVGGGEDAGADPLGIALALLSGLSYAVYATVAATLITRGHQDRVVAGALFGTAGLLFLPVLLVNVPAWAFTGTGAVIALYLGVITTGGGYLLFARGLRTTPATTATTLTLAEPAVAALLGVAVLGERLGVLSLTGLTLLAASLVILVWPNRR
ncbi:DMT family transporter [Actinomadura kijaniata]|uniref:DME family drug/metabolite transporter n=1 Tax=Actinomadura namibiensis TaxID=182080 RepID=A0A7W3LSM8_ACTNM|nr:EamA family transporter [Actinomadura namibiensis]MBA8953514.1 DME family drug/metabolite transporter [Actinomadura namibiensis]